MKLSKSPLPIITLGTLLLVTGCSSDTLNKSTPSTNSSKPESNTTTTNINKLNIDYTEHPLVKAFLEIKTDLRLPVDDLYSIIKSFDTDKYLLESDSSEDVGEKRYYKTFYTSDNDVKLTIKHTVDSFTEETNNPIAEYIQLTFINEGISLNYHILSDLTWYTVEKVHKSIDEQLSINTSLLNKKPIEDSYFKLIQILSSKPNTTLEDITKDLQIEFIKNPSEDIVEGEPSTYSYYDGEDHITLEVNNNIISSVVCSSTIIKENGPLEKEIYLSYNTLNPDNTRNISTTLTLINLEELFDSAKKLHY